MMGTEGGRDDSNNGAAGYGGCRQTIKQREGKHSKGREYLQRERLLTQRERLLTKGESSAMGWVLCQREGSFSAVIASFLAAV